MPIIQVSLIEGRDAPAKERLIRELTRAAVDALDAPIASVRVILQEVPAAHWGAGGVSKAESARQEARHG
jgi:4-oxalocrotonate tautomerase